MGTQKYLSLEERSVRYGVVCPLYTQEAAQQRVAFLPGNFCTLQKSKQVIVLSATPSKAILLLR